MIRSDEWQYHCLYLSFVVRGQYYNVLSIYAPYQQIMEELETFVGRNFGPGTSVTILGTMRLGGADADFTKEKQMAHLVVEG